MLISPLTHQKDTPSVTLLISLTLAITQFFNFNWGLQSQHITTLESVKADIEPILSFIADLTTYMVAAPR